MPAVFNCSARPSRETRELLASVASRNFCSRYSEMSRAFSRSVTRRMIARLRQAFGPMISTGVEGGASLIGLLRSSNMARTLP